jgi:phenylpropionate dioxygenase-like ring-hydroxylating dioxygenase large terminal subunit
MRSEASSPVAGLTSEMQVRADGFVPKGRYTSREFADLEFERFWPKVWQIAGREEELPEPGSFLEYRIGDDSILVVRDGDGAVRGFHNTCLHRGTRLASSSGTFPDGCIQCPYHGWQYALDGRLTRVVDREDFTYLPEELHLREVRTESFGGFVFVNLDDDATTLLEYLEPIPQLLAPYHLEHMRLRAYRTTIIDANWKAVIDAFNEGYHVQSLHPQILPWTDDVSIAYEQLGRHSHYGRLPNARRQLRPSPRLHLAEGDYDEGEILTGLVTGLGGAFLGAERAAVEELRASGPPVGQTLLEAYQARRMALLRERGVDVSGFTPDQMTSADDVFWFPNVVGPIYPGSALLFRVRPYERDPDRSLKDTWVLEWPADVSAWRMPERKFYADWTERNWGTITEQDYANLAEVQRGMKSSGCDGLWLNPRQEANILRMHRLIDEYLC